MIASNRNKIIRAFRRKEYPLPKMYISREGEIPHIKCKISIIREGEWKIFSNRIPVILNEQSKRRKRRKKIHVASKNGYFSDTTNSLQISIVGKNHWIGDEALVLGENVAYPFSVVSNSKVIVYEISIEDLMHSLPQNISLMLSKNWKKKLKFLESRVINICKSVSEVAKWDNYYQEYTDRITEVSKLFSQASKSAIK